MTVVGQEKDRNGETDNDLDLILDAIQAIEGENSESSHEAFSQPQNQPGAQGVHPNEGIRRNETETQGQDYCDYIVDPNQTFVTEILDGVVVEQKQCLLKFCGIVICDDTFLNKKKMNFFGIGLIVFACTIGISIILPQMMKHDLSSASILSSSSLVPSLVPSFAPSLIVTIAPSNSPTTFRSMHITESLFDISGEVILKANSSQNQALTWIIEFDKMNLTHASINLVPRYILMVLFYELGGEEWFQNEGYGTDKHECDWFGVKCSENQQIQSIKMQTNNLRGELPKEIGFLFSLQVISLGQNGIHGSIPTEIGQLTELNIISIPACRLSKTIPVEIGHCTKLIEIMLRSNNLSGTIPSTLQNVRNIIIVDLAMNNLSGTLPSYLSKLSNLEKLKLFRNQLSGTIPSEWDSTVFLTDLMLDDNNIVGTIPSNIGKLSSLHSLYVGKNMLEGTIPSQLGALSNLNFLELHANFLSGSIPDTFGFLTKIKYMDLSNNILNGTIPSAIEKLHRLDILELHGNTITGSMPDNICTFGMDKLTADCEPHSQRVSCSCCTECH